MTIPVIERLEVDERADLAVVVVGEVESVPRKVVCCPIQEEELPHSLDLAVKLMKVLYVQGVEMLMNWIILIRKLFLPFASF